MENFLTWEMLGTFAGAVLAVTALTQVLKNYIRFDAKWVALVLSILIVIGLQFVLGNFAVESWVLAVLNALVVAGTSIGAFESAVKPVENLLGKG